MNNIVLNVQGMTCNHCVKSVTQAVKSLEGVTEVNVSLAEGKVNVTAENNSITAEVVAQAIEDQGFTVSNS